MKKLSYEQSVANLRKLVTYLPVKERYETEINGTKYEILPTTEKEIQAVKGTKKYLLLEYRVHKDKWEAEEVAQIYAEDDRIKVWEGTDEWTGKKFYQWYSIHEPTEIEQLVTKIAHEKLDIPTLELRNMDDLDFHEVSVWGLKDALIAAYEAGIQAAEARK